MSSAKCPLALRRVSVAACFLISLSTALSAAATPLTGSSASIRARIESHKARDFSPLLAEWQKAPNPGTLSKELTRLAQDRTWEDRSRYVALQGAALLASRTGDTQSLSQLERLTEDSSWLIRSGVLKAFEGRDATRARGLAHALLQDSALVVRLEALSTLEKLKPHDPQTLQHLLGAAEDPRNWQGEKPLWIPERAVSLIEKIRNRRTPQSSTPLRAKIAALRKELK